MSVRSTNLIAEWINGDSERLYADLVGIDSRLPTILGRVADEVVGYDPMLPSWWEAEGILPKLGTYLLRYVAPAYELLRADGQLEFTNVLTAELLSVCAWRAFDNCMDAHVSHKVAHLASLAGFARLSDFSQKCWPTRRMGDLQRHYVVMADSAIRETDEPLEVGDIWKRCSILLYPLESLAMLGATGATTFKAYINYSGLAHDVDDLFADIAGNIMSLPVTWFRETNQRGKLNVKDIAVMYSRAQDAVRPIGRYFAAIDVRDRLPLIARLLQDSIAIIEGVNGCAGMQSP